MVDSALDQRQRDACVRQLNRMRPTVVPYESALGSSRRTAYTGIDDIGAGPGQTSSPTLTARNAGVYGVPASVWRWASRVGRISVGLP